MSAKAMMSLRDAAASASSSSGSSRTWAQNIDIAKLQKFQLNKGKYTEGVTGGASYSYGHGRTCSKD
jgi:hypothetical protein